MFQTQKYLKIYLKIKYLVYYIIMKYNKNDKLTTNYKKKNVLMNVEGVNWFLNDENMKHFQSLPPERQAAVQQMMLLQKLKETYGE